MSYDGKKRPATGRISHANARMLYELVWIGAGCVVIGWLGGWLNLDALWPGLAAASYAGVRWYWFAMPNIRKAHERDVREVH
jgi:hypothetical protein